MVYIFENLSLCGPEWLKEKEKTLPPWRLEKEKALKKQADKVRSVAAFLLLERALQDRGISSVPEFAYEDIGKPYLPGYPVHFSLSHCKNAVVCAVADAPVGVDVQDKLVFSSRLAERICSDAEREALERAEDKDWALTAIWTKKEALAKRSGKGLGEKFSSLEEGVFTLSRPGYCLSVTEEDPPICIIINEL